LFLGKKQNGSKYGSMGGGIGDFFDSLGVLFFLRKNQLLKNGEAPVSMRITVNGQREEVRTKKSINPALWNQAIQTVDFHLAHKGRFQEKHGKPKPCGFLQNFGFITYRGGNRI
jgi:hypothetical protein